MNKKRKFIKEDKLKYSEGALKAYGESVYEVRKLLKTVGRLLDEHGSSFVGDEENFEYVDDINKVADNLKEIISVLDKVGLNESVRKAIKLVEGVTGKKVVLKEYYDEEAGVKVGDIVRIISDNDNYDNYIDLDLTVTHCSNEGRYYDEEMYPEMLCDFVVTETGEDVPFSLYEYEFEVI